LETGNKLSTLTLTEKYNAIAALAFAKDNTILINLGQSRELAHWDVNTGRKLADTSKVDQYTAVAFSQDGGTLATGDKMGWIRLWDPTTGTQRVMLSEPSNMTEDPGIRALAFSTDGKMLASRSEDQTVLLWDTQNNTKLAALKGHEGWVTAVAFSADGKTLATGDANKIIKLWDVSTGGERATLKGHKNTINALTFAPDETPLYSGCLATGSADGTIRFWNPDTGKELVTFSEGHTEWVKAVAFAKNGTMLTSAAFNGTVEVWDLTTRRELITFTAGHSDSTESVVFSADAMLFANRGAYGLIAFDAFGFGSRGSFQGGSGMRLWELTTGDELSGPWQDWTGTTASFVFSSDNKVLASRDGRDILAWDVDTGIELFRIHTEKPFPRKLVFSPNRTLLAAHGIHGETQVWDVDAHQKFPIFITEDANSLAFSPDGTLLALGHRDGIVLWDVTLIGFRKRIEIPDSWRGFEDVLTFSPDGKTLLAPTLEIWDPLIKLWDVDTGQDLGTLSGHTEPIETLVFSHDGKTLASGSQDGTVLLWDWDKIIAKTEQDNR
jgi:WD40 repeat protein